MYGVKHYIIGSIPKEQDSTLLLHRTPHFGAQRKPMYTFDGYINIFKHLLNQVLVSKTPQKGSTRNCENQTSELCIMNSLLSQRAIPSSVIIQALNNIKSYYGA